jgi:hypothetical protein
MDVEAQSKHSAASATTRPKKMALERTAEKRKGKPATMNGYKVDESNGDKVGETKPQRCRLRICLRRKQHLVHSRHKRASGWAPTRQAVLVTCHQLEGADPRELATACE